MGPGVPDDGELGEYDSGAYYFTIYGGDRSAVKASAEQAIGDSGIFTRFSVGINAAPATGSWTFRLMRGETALLSCTITGQDRACSATGNVSFASTDKFCILFQGADSPTSLFTAASFQLKYWIQ